MRTAVCTLAMILAIGFGLEMLMERGSASSPYALYLPAVFKPDPTPTPTPTPVPGTPPAPVLISPANGAQLDTISPAFTVDNSAAGGAAWARIVGDRDQSFNLEGFGTAWGPFSGTFEGMTFFNLRESTTYYWKASSSFDGVSWGSWSEARSFRTGSGGTVPGDPTLTSPSSGSTVDSLRPTLTWSEVPGATRYAVLVASYPTVAYTFYTRGASLSISSDLAANTNFSWLVYAGSNYGWGSRSSVWTFRTPP